VLQLNPTIFGSFDGCVVMNPGVAVFFGTKRPSSCQAAGTLAFLSDRSWRRGRIRIGGGELN
jgi:hypothetical protein